jgi:hypothetical protein
VFGAGVSGAGVPGAGAGVEVMGIVSEFPPGAGVSCLIVVSAIVGEDEEPLFVGLGVGGIVFL